MTLLAGLKSWLEPSKFNCYRCITQHGKSAKMKGKAERSRTSKGCFDYVTKSYLVENVKYSTCIGNLVKPIDYLLESYVQYGNGIMPFSGGLSEQPNKIIEAYNVISHMKYEQEKIDNK